MPAITCNFQFYIVLHKGVHRNKMLFFFMALHFSDLLMHLRIVAMPHKNKRIIELQKT